MSYTIHYSRYGGRYTAPVEDEADAIRWTIAQEDLGECWVDGFSDDSGKFTGRDEWPALEAAVDRYHAEQDAQGGA